MDYEKIKRDYQSNKTKYDTLGKNVVESVKIILKDANIKILSLNYRVKDTLSFLEKIERKSYDNPIEEIEDICGIRIICFYQKDVEKITELLTKEFAIHESQNKESKLDFDQFGYRSQHLIASINSAISLSGFSLIIPLLTITHFIFLSLANLTISYIYSKKIVGSV